MTDLALLNRIIKERGITKGKIAETLGITRQGLHLKLTGKNDFTVTELRNLIKVLGLTRKEVHDIFFSKHVH